MNRRSVIKLMFGASVGSAMGQSQVASQQPSFRFGVIADPQYVDAKSSGSRHYRESISSLKWVFEAVYVSPDFYVAQFDSKLKIDKLHNFNKFHSVQFGDAS